MVPRDLHVHHVSGRIKDCQPDGRLVGIGPVDAVAALRRQVDEQLASGRGVAHGRIMARTRSLIQLDGVDAESGSVLATK